MFQQILILVGSVCYFAVHSFKKWGVKYPFVGIPDAVDTHKMDRINYTNETKCRNIFEVIFDKPFPKKRPALVKKSRNKPNIRIRWI